MSVVNRLSDWPRATVSRQYDRELQGNGTLRSAEIVILPCVRRERLDEQATPRASRG